MHIELKLHHLDSEELLHKYVARRLHFVLSRFGNRIGKVAVRLSAPNNSELACLMTAELHSFGVITAESVDVDALSAIDQCAGRLARRCESKCNRLRGGALDRATIRVSKIA